MPEIKLSEIFNGTQSALGPRWPGHYFSHFEKSSPQEIKLYLEFRSVLLDFQSFTEKPAFDCGFAHAIMLFFIIFGSKQYGWCLCDMQISYGMVSNAHVRHAS